MIAIVFGILVVALFAPVIIAGIGALGKALYDIIEDEIFR